MVYKVVNLLVASRGLGDNFATKHIPLFSFIAQLCVGGCWGCLCHLLLHLRSSPRF